MYTYESLRQRYAEADFLQPRHVEATKRFLKDWPRSDIQEFVADNLVTHRLGRVAFQTLLHIPSDPSDQIIVVPTGYGTGFKVPAVARALAIREIVDPHAALVVQTNVAPGYLANNFSVPEEQLLDQGDFKPMRDRLNIALENAGRTLPNAKVAYAGGSLGAAVVGSVLGHAQEMALDSNGGTIIDPANITERGFARLAGDFAQDMPEMAMVGASNFTLSWWAAGVLSRKGSIKGERTRAGAGKAALYEAFHLAKALSNGRLKEDLLASPRDVGIVHVWSRRSTTSPDEANQLIADEMRAGDHPLYVPVRITHPFSRHGVTVAFALQGAALEHVMELSSQHD